MTAGVQRAKRRKERHRVSKEISSHSLLEAFPVHRKFDRDVGEAGVDFGIRLGLNRGVIARIFVKLSNRA